MNIADKFLRIAFFLQNTSGSCFCTLGTTVLENIVKRNGRKYSHDKFSYNYLGSPTQADHILQRPQYSHVFFILLSCFSCRKFEKTLVAYNGQKPDLFRF